MVEDYTLIKYKWQSGVYDLVRIVELVMRKELTEKEFMDITGYNYQGVLNSMYGDQFKKK